MSHDRAKAIAKCVEAVVGGGSKSRKSVELIEVLPGKGLIVVGPSRQLRKISWLRLVEIAPARYLLIFPSGTPVEQLEVGLHDLLENLAPDESDERHLLEELRNLLTCQRRAKSVTKAELVFVDL